MKNIWFDITNTPQVHFLTAIYNSLKLNTDFNFLFTARDFSETIRLLESKITIPFQVIGRHYGKNTLRKIAGLIFRYKDALKAVSQYDISISCGSESAIWTSFVRRKISIAFGDNDQARQWTYGYFVDFAFFPDAIPTDLLSKQGLHSRKIHLYPGFKEDIYLADYQPDPTFRRTIPFENFVVVRPENILANYIRRDNVKSITPELLNMLSSKGFNILYLPRYDFDKTYADGIKNIYIPDSPINGLDACYYSDAVLTGAGTFAREAACLGVPSFSFYVGKDLLAVDKKMINFKWMYFSRDPGKLVEKTIRARKRSVDLSRCRAVRDGVISKCIEILSD